MIGHDNKKLQRRQLGDTEIHISPIGLGTVKFGRNQGVKYPNHFDLPSDNAISELLNQAKDLGINVLDTAPAYGTSEERLGHLLKEQRQDWVIIGKAGEEFNNGQSHYDFTPEHFKRSLERSLERLDTDYIDVLLIHSNGDDMAILNDDALIKTMHDFKKNGLVRAIGASTKTAQGGIKALELMDVVMACYNPSYTDEKSVLDYAVKHNKGVLLKKVFASGHIDSIGGSDPVQEAMNFAFAHYGTSAAMLGTINPHHMTQNVQACLKALENR